MSIVTTLPEIVKDLTVKFNQLHIEANKVRPDKDKIEKLIQSVNNIR